MNGVESWLWRWQRKLSLLCQQFPANDSLQDCVGVDVYHCSLRRELMVRWLTVTPPLHLVGYDMAVNVKCSPELALFQMHILEDIIQQHTIPPQASLRFIRTLSIAHIWSTLVGDMQNALSANSIWSRRTDWRFTINNITLYWSNIG